MYKKILLPVSGKTQQRSLKGLKHALDMCEEEIILLHVCEPLPNIVGGAQRNEIKLKDEEEGRGILTPYIEEIEKAGLQARVRIEHGSPSDVIIHVAQEEFADLIIMYTDGRDGVSDMLLGSVTERVLRGTDTTLLAVRR